MVLVTEHTINSHSSFWIRIHDLLLSCTNGDVGLFLDSMIGKVDTDKTGLSFEKFMRIQVKIEGCDLKMVHLYLFFALFMKDFLISVFIVVKLGMCKERVQSLISML